MVQVAANGEGETLGMSSVSPPASTNQMHCMQSECAGAVRELEDCYRRDSLKVWTV